MPRASLRAPTARRRNWPWHSSRCTTRPASVRVIVSTYQAVSGAGLQGNTDLLEGTKAPAQRSRLPVPGLRSPNCLQCHPADRQREGRGIHERRNEDGLRDPQDSGRRIDPDQRHVRPHSRRQLPQRVHHGRNGTAGLAGGGPSAVCRIPGLERDRRHGQRQTTPALHCSGSDDTFIGRIRRDLSHPNGLNFWCVSDNLRKGAATNAVQIAELLARHRSPQRPVPLMSNETAFPFATASFTAKTCPCGTSPGSSARPSWVYSKNYLLSAGSAKFRRPSRRSSR